MKHVLVVLLGLMLFACNDKGPETYQPKVKPEKQRPLRPSDADVDMEEIELSSSYQNMALSGARNIGEFFDHRIRFFKIDAPNMTIGNSKVDDVVLYFVDSTLARIRYSLHEDVSNFLMDSLGVSRFKPLDDRSKELLASHNVWNKYNRKLHEDLRNYELVWRKSETVTRFRVYRNEQDSVRSFTYYHEIPGYKDKIREIETLYNIMDKATPIADLN